MTTEFQNELAHVRCQLSASFIGNGFKDVKARYIDNLPVPSPISGIHPDATAHDGLGGILIGLGITTDMLGNPATAALLCRLFEAGTKVNGKVVLGVMERNERVLNALLARLDLPAIVLKFH